MSTISIEFFDAKNTSRSIATIDDVSPSDNVLTLKKKIAAKSKTIHLWAILS